MDVLPLVVHGDHPQSNTDEEQQHCNGVTSSVHEQPLAKQSKLITAKRFMAGMEALHPGFERKRSSKEAPQGSVA